jgi:type IV secretory pathway VirB2 component (pilin)
VTFVPLPDAAGQGNVGAGKVYSGLRRPTMKLIAVAALVAVCLALLAGKDDIRRFQRMRQM